jgi:hypothetical protein
MARIDLRGLIDEVLSLVKDRNASLNNQSGGWYGGNKDEEEYWKEMRKRNTALEGQKLINEGQTNLQEMKGQNELAVHGVTESGATARQKLLGDTERYKADQSLLGEKYKADKTAESLSGSAKTDPRALLFKTWGESTDPTPERLATLEAGYKTIFGKPQESNQTSTKQPPTDFGASERPDTMRTLPAAQPPVSSGGAASMTFGTDMGTASVNPLRKRKEALDAFYRSNPGMKRILE